MREFDGYINSIIGNLQVSKKKKAEMFDEYRYHLVMLKQDYVNNGFTEEAATEEAIKSFGSSENLKALFNNIFGYRTTTNILIGITFTIVLFVLGSHITLPGLFMTTNTISIPSTVWMLIPFTWIFIPVGYFLPIMIRRAGKMKITISASILLSLIMGIISSFNLGSVEATLITNLYQVQIAIVVGSILGGSLGSAIGFIVLNMISKVALKLRYS